jgi:hypothetical protein
MAREVSFARDPDAAHAQYAADGYFVEPDVFSAAECEAMIEAAMALPQARADDYAPIMQIHKIEPRFLDVLGDPRLLAVMDRACHGRAAGVQTQFYFTPPQRAGLGTHQDNYFVEAPDDSFASAWVALVDITPENGGLYAYRGSHFRGALPVREVTAPNGGDKRQSIYEETILPEPFEKVDLSVKRGSAVIIHGFNVHGSYQNHSAANRCVILNTYVREGAPFRPGATAKREAITFARA